jgi:hypothetical protein
MTWAWLETSSASRRLLSPWKLEEANLRLVQLPKRLVTLLFSALGSCLSTGGTPFGLHAVCGRRFGDAAARPLSK